MENNTKRQVYFGQLVVMTGEDIVPGGMTTDGIEAFLKAEKAAVAAVQAGDEKDIIPEYAQSRAGGVHADEGDFNRNRPELQSNKGRGTAY